jgi:hypothetical protein
MSAMPIDANTFAIGFILKIYIKSNRSEKPVLFAPVDSINVIINHKELLLFYPPDFTSFPFIAGSQLDHLV